jgi:hypothetical protein
MHPRILLVPAALAATLAMSAGAPAPAHAFCGFYIDGAGKDMFAEATQVVLMRKGTRTVLSMRNAYKGPVEDFAMVVPVPVVLQEADVKTLPVDVFDRVDTMGSPRLVEYWEQDPCAQTRKRGGRSVDAAEASKSAADSKPDKDTGVTVEAQFSVGEYEIVILSAKESTGLATWLVDSGYKIPKKAEPALRPYVEAGSKFFVAKVDPSKVSFDPKGRAMLSPLRFHYDTDQFALPIRLGLINSSGKQDLIVNILSQGQRYEVANYKNATIPTNIEVKDEVRKKFGEFYVALFDRTLDKNPGAVITEYAWDASTCDPCPGPVLGWNDFATLGADVLDGGKAGDTSKRSRRARAGFVLTRLHVRYDKKTMTDDLVFREATAIAGGREHLQANGKLEEGAVESSVNNFQARYIIRHPWTGKIACDNPRRGIWGGPPRGSDVQLAADVKPARGLAFAPRGKIKLQNVVKQNIPEIGIKAAKKKPKKKIKPTPKVSPPAPQDAAGKGAAAPASSPRGAGLGAALAGLIVLGGVVARRRRGARGGNERP